MNRFRFLLFLLVGLGLGIGLGLVTGWVIWPTEFTDANPAVLQDRYRHDYVQMIADGYALDGDLTLARRRLTAVAPTPQDALLPAITDKALADSDAEAIQRMAILARDLNISSPVMAPFLP